MNWLFNRFSKWRHQSALVWDGEVTTYGELLDLVEAWGGRFDELKVTAGQVVALYGDYTPQTCSMLLALFRRNAIVVPLTEAASTDLESLLATAQVEVFISFEQGDRWTAERRDVKASHPLLAELQATGDAGLVLFSSGSTGESKAALHNMRHLLEKFKVPRQRLSTLVFLLLDHIGGLNTLLYTLSNGGKLVTLNRRDPDVVCAAIQDHGVELLPTSPTFLNMLLVSESYRRYDLSSLKLITYGTEVMPASTLKRLRQVLPWVRLQQTYGLSELGILRSKSEDPDSLWVKVGGEGYETKVVDGILWIRSRSAMLGYLNAESPFDEDGWMNTQDRVEVRGEYLRFLGRQSEIINVGGLKVHPSEIESVLLEMEGVREVVVCGEGHPVTGQIVTAQVSLAGDEDMAAFRRRMRSFCRDRLSPFKIPVRVRHHGGEHHPRYKRVRRTAAKSTQ